MNLYREILIKALENEKIEVTFPDMKVTPEELVEMKCCAALQKIKKIIDDETLTDADCYQKIEAIIQTLEKIGSNGGTRHDFG